MPLRAVRKHRHEATELDCIAQLVSRDDIPTMGISPTDTAHGYRYTQEWLNSSSSNQGTSSAQQRCDQHEEGLAARLYSSCRRVLRDLCWQEQTSPSRTSQSLFLRDELMKFYLWGQSFGPGELDTALEHSDDARYLVLEALRVIGQSLLRGKVSKNCCCSLYQ